MDENYGKQAEALIALVTELKHRFRPIIVDLFLQDSTESNPSDEQTWLNHLATICAEAWEEKIALTWMQSETQVDLYIASSLPITDEGCFGDHLKEIWGILCGARTQYEADHGSNMSDSVDQVKNKVFPRLENQLFRFLQECRATVGRLSSLPSPPAFVDEAIAAIDGMNGSKVQVRDFFDEVCRHAKEWKNILNDEKDLDPLDRLINRVSELNAAMKGLVELFVKLTEPRSPNALQVHLQGVIFNENTILSSFQREDWLKVAGDARLECTREEFDSAITRLSNAQHHTVPIHPALVLYTQVQSKGLDNTKWIIGSRSKLCRACAEYIKMDCIVNDHTETAPRFQGDTESSSFAYPWALPSTWDDALRKDFYLRIKNTVSRRVAFDPRDDYPCVGMPLETPPPLSEAELKGLPIGKLRPLRSVGWEVE